MLLTQAARTVRACGLAGAGMQAAQEFQVRRRPGGSSRPTTGLSSSQRSIPSQPAPRRMVRARETALSSTNSRVCGSRQARPKSVITAAARRRVGTGALPRISAIEEPGAGPEVEPFDEAALRCLQHHERALRMRGDFGRAARTGQARRRAHHSCRSPCCSGCHGGRSARPPGTRRRPGRPAGSS